MRISVAISIICIAVMAMCKSVAAEDHAVPPEQPNQQVSASTSEQQPPGRDVCTTVSWGFDDVVKTDCSYRLLPQLHDNPALKGICMTVYGNRTCY
jgi:hypothetical protein